MSDGPPPIVNLEFRGVHTDTGLHRTAGEPALAFAHHDGRVCVAINTDKGTAYAWLDADAIDMAGHAFAAAIEHATRDAAPTVRSIQ